MGRPDRLRPDRGLDPRDALRHALRPLDGLRGVPRLSDARGVGRRGDQRGGGRPRPHEDGAARHRRRPDHVRGVHRGFVAGSVVGLQQFGFGLAAAILIDVTIVRALLVPSAMKLFGRWNWWLPERPRPDRAGRALPARRPPRLGTAPGSGVAAPRLASPRCSRRASSAPGGEATRLGELTRVANKHLLPVGSWPMIYYPLQLLQLAGIRDVLLVTGKGHAGQMIDLLGDGRLAPRGGGDPILELDLTYKVQTEPGGSRRSSAWRGTSRPARRSSSCSATTSSSSRSRPRSCGVGARGRRRAHLRQGRSTIPRTSASSSTRDGRVTDIVEKAGVVDTRYDAPAFRACRRRPLLLSARRLRRHRDVSSRRRRGELEITDVNRHYALAGPPRGARGRGLVGGRRQALAAPRRHRAAHRGDWRQQGGALVIEGVAPPPAARVRGRARLVLRAAPGQRPAEADGADEPVRVARGRRPRPPLPRTRPGRSLRVPPRDSPRRRPRPRRPGRRSPRTSATTTASRSTFPGHHAHGFEALTDVLFALPRHAEYDPADPDEHTIPWNDPRVAHLWSTSTPILSARDAVAS